MAQSMIEALCSQADTKTKRAILALICQDRLRDSLTPEQVQKIAGAAAGIMINELFAYMTRDKMTIENIIEVRGDLAEAISDISFLLGTDLCAYRHAKKLFEAIWEAPGTTVIDLLNQTKMLDELDQDQLQIVVDSVMQANPKIVDQIRAGKTAAIGALIGQVMKTTKADPKQTRELIQKRLDETPTVP